MIYTIKEYYLKMEPIKKPRKKRTCLNPYAKMTKEGKENIRQGKLNQWRKIKLMQEYFDTHKIVI